MTTRATASWPSSALAARFEIDRGREAIGLLVERRAGAILVDQRVERPAGLVEPGRLGRDRRRELDRHRLRGLGLRTTPMLSPTAVVAAATAGVETS